MQQAMDIVIHRVCLTDQIASQPTLINNPLAEPQDRHPKKMALTTGWTKLLAGQRQVLGFDFSMEVIWGGRI